MNPNRSPIRHAAAKALAITAIICGTVGVTGSAGAVNSTEVDTMAWLDDVSTAVKVDQTVDCMNLATDAVAYRNDRIVLRTGALDKDIKKTVNFTLNDLDVNNVNFGRLTATNTGARLVQFSGKIDF